jgi:hypothetical protein
MSNLFKKKAEVLNHWFAFADGFQTSTLEFYDALAKELSAREVPQMELSRIELPEGGLLSQKRIYLRMLRERLVFDVCASPFGTGFFFSCRTAEIPLAIPLAELAFAVVLGLSVAAILVYWLGFILGAVTVLLGLAGSVFVLRNSVSMGLQNLDTTLLQIPVLGPLYEVFLRKETYHRIDSRLCYLEVVPTLVKKLAEDTAAAKGVKLVRQYELAPVLGELYRPSPLSPVIPVTPPAQPPLP